jgi:SAM-dependent methyltransferase
MSFQNVYQDTVRAEAYATLDYSHTYHLAFRDLPGLLEAHASGRRALDFGCGAGRSTRFLRGLGYETVGVDIAPEMLALARQRDPGGRYLQVGDGELGSLAGLGFDVVLCAFPFDNIPSRAVKLRILRSLRERLTPRGLLVNLVSSPEIYWNEWASFTTCGFAESNRRAATGDVVRIVTTTIPDARPCDDILFPESEYRRLHAEAGFATLGVHKPLALGNEPYAWKAERHTPPWHLHLLTPAPS